MRAPVRGSRRRGRRIRGHRHGRRAEGGECEWRYRDEQGVPGPCDTRGRDERDGSGGYGEEGAGGVWPD